MNDVELATCLYDHENTGPGQQARGKIRRAQCALRTAYVECTVRIIRTGTVRRMRPSSKTSGPKAAEEST